MDSESYQKFLDEHEARLDKKLIPASTVVMMRDNNSQIEVLMLLRNPELKFMGGAWVFPGGKLDAADFDESKDLVRAIKIAAQREVKEESNLDIDLENLVPHSHWLPPSAFPKLFATWFFLALAPDAEIKIDGSEILDYQWLTPQAALDKRDAGEFEFVPPTFVTLSKLVKYDSSQVALDAVAQETEPFYETKMIPTDEGHIALWQGDAGYEKGDPSISGSRNRLNLSDEKWRLETSVVTGTTQTTGKK